MTADDAATLAQRAPRPSCGFCTSDYVCHEHRLEDAEADLAAALQWLSWALEALERAAPQVHRQTAYGDTYRKADAFLAAHPVAK